MYKKSKYRNIKIEFQGRKFDSKRELKRYLELKQMQNLGLISNLECQPKYIFKNLRYKSNKLVSYYPDFRYIENGQVVVEDVKSKATKTASYNIKWALMKFFYNIDVKEILK